MISTKKSIGISFAGQYVETAIHFVAVMILARILSPEDIGIYTVAAFLMAVLHAFREFGVVQYLIQEHELTKEKMQTATGVAILLATAVAVSLLALSGPIADLYGKPQLKKIIVVMALTFAISPLGSLLYSLLRREMEFKKIFVVQIISALSHVTVAITLASLGYGALSLAWANFCGVLAGGIVFNLMRPKWVPWLPRFRNMKAILTFGSIASIGNAANTAGTNVPDLIVGKVMDMTSVGYLSRANGLIQLFARLLTQSLLPLALPYFSQVRRKGESVSTHYLASMVYLTVFAWPFFAVLTVLAEPLVRTLYGPQWDNSVPIVRWLCIAGAISALTLFAGQVMVANGQVRHSTCSQLLAQTFRIAAVLIASMHSLVDVAIAMVASEGVTLLVVSWYLRKTTNVGIVAVLYACRKNAVVAVCSAMVPLILKMSWKSNDLHPWLPLALGILGATAGWITGLFLTKHPLTDHLLTIPQSLALFVRKKKNGESGGSEDK
jgi:O-antigen/teichoic acid export membrane protein